MESVAPRNCAPLHQPPTPSTHAKGLHTSRGEQRVSPPQSAHQRLTADYRRASMGDHVSAFSPHHSGHPARPSLRRYSRLLSCCIPTAQVSAECQPDARASAQLRILLVLSYFALHACGCAPSRACVGSNLPSPAQHLRSTPSVKPMLTWSCGCAPCSSDQIKDLTEGVEEGTVWDGGGHRYHLEKVVGNGAFGIVWRARSEDGEVVAIKKVMLDRRYHNRELQMMKVMEHENVVRLRHYFEKAGRKKDETFLHLVMDYLPETIRSVALKHHKRARRFHVDHIKAYLCQTFRALEYIHARRICHRDIKPDNLLCDPATLKCRLCDFGCSKVREQSSLLARARQLSACPCVVSRRAQRLASSCCPLPPSGPRRHPTSPALHSRRARVPSPPYAPHPAHPSVLSFLSPPSLLPLSSLSPPSPLPLSSLSPPSLLLLPTTTITTDRCSSRASRTSRTSALATTARPSLCSARRSTPCRWTSGQLAPS